MTANDLLALIDAKSGQSLILFSNGSAKFGYNKWQQAGWYWRSETYPKPLIDELLATGNVKVRESGKGTSDYWRIIETTYEYRLTLHPIDETDLPF